MKKKKLILVFVRRMILLALIIYAVVMNTKVTRLEKELCQYSESITTIKGMLQSLEVDIKNNNLRSDNLESVLTSLNTKYDTLYNNEIFIVDYINKYVKADEKLSYIEEDVTEDDEVEEDK